MAKRFEVVKNGRIYCGVGEIAVIRGKLVNEPTTAAFRTLRDAEAYCARWNKINVEMVADLAAERADRCAAALRYLAARAERRPAQFGFNF